jgi:hypothetical protein
MNGRGELRMIAWKKTREDFSGSLYREPCPLCGARPFEWCRSREGSRTRPHAERRGAGAPRPGR